MTTQLDTEKKEKEIIERLSEPCIEELKSSVENERLKWEDCRKLTKEISKKVHNEVKDAVNREGYNSSTITCLLSAWYTYKPNEVSLLTLLNILRSQNINNDALASLADRLEPIYTKIRKPLQSEAARVNGDGNNNGMEVDGGKGNPLGSPEKYNSSLQRNEIQKSLRQSKRLARQAQKDKEEARKKNQEARKTSEEARKTSEEARKTSEEARKTREEGQRLKDWAAMKMEEAQKMMENIHISKKKVDKKHFRAFQYFKCSSGCWCSSVHL